MAIKVQENDKIIALCERAEIAVFVNFYMQYMRKQGLKVPSVRIINFQELEKLPSYLDMLAEAEGFEHLRKVIVFGDATPKRRDKEHELYKAKQHSFLRNFAYDLFLFPCKTRAGNFKPGYLEDLLVPALKQDSAESSYFYNLTNIAHEYIFSVHTTRGKDNRFVNYNRNFLYTYFAGTERFCGLRMGEAAAKGAFDLEHEGFKDLRDFLSKIAYINGKQIL